MPLYSGFSARLKEEALKVFESKVSLTQLRKVLVVLVPVLVLAAFGSAAWGQAVPVYVSGGPYIYQVSGGTATPIVNTAGSNYASLAIGPDNVDLDAHGNASHPYLIYACDINNDKIIRFDPANPGGSETVYNNTTSITPVCGRFTSTGDFYVTNAPVADGNVMVYEFKGIANVKLGSLTALQMTPSTVSLTGLSTNVANAGITQKNVGDLLLVDNTNSVVLRAPYGNSVTPFSTVTTYITTNLSSPSGIARTSTGDVFVSNAGTSNVAHFASTGLAAANCPSITFPTASDTRIFYLGASETDSIFAAASDSSPDYFEDQDYDPEADDPGEVWSWSASQGGCMFQSVALTPTILSGIAVAPVPTATISQALASPLPPAASVPTTFNFNSNAFQITAHGCSATVTAYPLDLATVISAIGLASSGLPNGATPLVNLGEDGYEIAYVATYPSPSIPACTSVFSDGTFANAIFGLYDSTLTTNPRIVQCDSIGADILNEPLLSSSTTCQALTLVGAYPLGGIIPTDLGTIGKSKGNSVFFLVNAGFAPASAGGGAQFCGFLPPLKNTTNPAVAATFDSDDIIPIIFRLASATGNCTRGPFVNNAKALLSIAQIADGSGNPVFNPLFTIKTVLNQGSIFPNLLSFYTLLLPVYGSPAPQLVPGTYSLSVLFETNNAPQQTIVFKVVPGK
jgi:hypothetical protein